jgi:hypothetical protein
MEFVWSQHRLDNAEAWFMVGSIDFEGAMMLFQVEGKGMRHVLQYLA